MKPSDQHRAEVDRLDDALRSEDVGSKEWDLALCRLVELAKYGPDHEDEDEIPADESSVAWAEAFMHAFDSSEDQASSEYGDDDSYHDRHAEPARAKRDTFEEN